MSRRPLAALPLLAVLLGGCSAGQETAPPSAAPAPSASSSASPAASPSAPAVRVIAASFTGGEVQVENARVETSLGEQVVLRISSDVLEEIHVHGYDVYADVPAGGTVDIPLTLTLPGSYEVELHEAGRPLFQLRTS